MNLKNSLVFTATYNEAGNIAKLLDKILRLNINIDILIIDDNSPDKTFEIIEKYCQKYSNITLVKREKKQGLDTAHKYAFNYAREKNYINFITMDADLSHDPKEIPVILNHLDNYPFVIGSRYMKGGKNNMALSRYILSYLGNIFIKYVLNLKNSEFTTSYRGFNLNKLKGFNLNDVNSKGYSFFMETIFLLNKSGYKFKEIPIIFENRTRGYSKIPKVEIFRTFKNVIYLLFKK